MNANALLKPSEPRLVAALEEFHDWLRSQENLLDNLLEVQKEEAEAARRRVSGRLVEMAARKAALMSRQEWLEMERREWAARHEIDPALPMADWAAFLPPLAAASWEARWIRLRIKIGEVRRRNENENSQERAVVRLPSRWLERLEKSIAKEIRAATPDEAGPALAA